MTLHKTRTKRLARGAKTGNMVRVMGSFRPDDWKWIVYLAKKRGVPAAEILRNAIWAYVLPFKNNPTIKDEP